MDDVQLETFGRVGTAIALGLLVGMQREHTESSLAGLRTFALVTLLGVLCALAGEGVGSWAVAAGLVALAAVVGVANTARLRDEAAEPGITTEVALFVMFVVGAYLMQGHWIVAVAAGVTVAVLLQFKVEMHGVVQRLGDEDLRAIMTFALISGVILPVLPREPVDPYGVLSPYEVWLMVVLIVGISLVGYAAYKFVGQHAGILLGGMLGGAISSTATVASYARQSKTAPSSARLAVVVIGIASAVVFVRVLIEISVVSPHFLPIAAWPLGILGAATILPALALWLHTTQEPGDVAVQRNPTELKSALIFAGIYAGVTLLLAVAKERFGSQGLYVVAILSGLTDMDAITLSTSRMVGDPAGGDAEAGISPALGWRLIAVASMSNLVFKGVMAAVLGHKKLAWRVAALFAVPLAVGAGLIAFWPA